MRQIIVDEHLDEVEVHPPGLYQRLMDLSISSAGEILGKPESFSEAVCPACASANRQRAFEKHGYTYWSCHTCATLFVSPRPSEAQLDWYLLQSPCAELRDSSEYRETMAPRTRELAAYRAEWVSELCDRGRRGSVKPIVDVETRFPDYLSELQHRGLKPLVCVKPLGSLSGIAAAEEASFEAANGLADLSGVEARLVTAFDILEHQTDPGALALSAYEVLEPGGLFVITTRSSSGFDVQVLWEHATVFPVEHINLLSVEGLQSLLIRTGFEIQEISTPGQLDVQLIERVLHEHHDADIPRFLRYFLSHRDRSAKHRLQQFLQANLLSSHLRVVATKAM